MKLRWLFLISSLILNSAATAGGDGEFVGLDQQGQGGFVLSFSVDSANGEAIRASSIRVFRQPKTWTDRGQLMLGSIRGTGCSLFPEGYAAVAIICLPNAEPSFLRGVIYAKKETQKKNQFVCVNNCSKQVPKYFDWVPNNEE